LPAVIALAIAAAVLVAGCGAGGDTPGSDCGPTEGVVSRVIDGDTIELATGERVRYLMVDTPENTTEIECYGPEATEQNRLLVEGQAVTLEYDVECTDRFDRLLAYVSVGDREVNAVLLERGYACLLHIPPNGADRVDQYETLELRARSGNFGLWAACETIPC
jgi:micrococcal nuclease